MNTRSSPITLALAIALAGSSSVYAQNSGNSDDNPDRARSSNAAQADAQQAADSEPVQLESVSVTAQRREQVAQTIPMSIDVAAGPELKRLQIKRIDDLEFITPNVIMMPNTGTSGGAKIIMRGVGTVDSIFTQDPSIAIYVDGVYIARQNGAMLDLYNVKRIEVLRGPQGTLYGRNSTGGAIRYITEKPNGEKHFSVSGSIGNYGRVNGRATMSTHIGDINMSLAVLSKQRDGIMHDLTHDRWVNDQDVRGGRLSFTWDFGAASQAYLTMDMLDMRSSPAWATPVALDDNGNRYPVLGDYRVTETNILGDNDLDQSGIALTTETDFGNLLLRNIIHYRQFEQHLYMDMDGTARKLLEVEQHQNQHQKGYEAQFISQAPGPISWVGGLFFFSEHNDQATRSDVFVTGPTNHATQETTAYALYGQGTWFISPGWRLTAGARYSRETKEYSVIQLAADGGFNFRKDLERTWSRPDWKLSLDHDFSRNVMGYVSLTTGFKSGGFNGRGTTYETITAYDEETLLAYEVGMKSTFLDRRVRFNADYYRLDYAGIQLSALNNEGVFATTNATGALIQGVEAEIQAQITSGLMLAGNIGTINAEYRDYSAANAHLFEGMEMKDTPNLTGSLRMNYIHPVANGQMIFSAQARYTAESYQTQDNSPLILSEAHTMVRARLAYESSDNWSIGLWGRNLTDQYVSRGGFHVAGLGVATLYPNTPRTYGVDFEYHFW